MIRVADDLWIGNSDDAYLGSVDAGGIDAALCVARDLADPVSLADAYQAPIVRERWRDREYAKVGLVDGPGNEVSDYCAAVLVLASLLKRHDAVLVYDHDGGRALAVCHMYLCLSRGRRPAGGGQSQNMHCWEPWGQLLDDIATLFGWPDSQRVHEAHIAAYESMPFGILEMLVR